MCIYVYIRVKNTGLCKRDFWEEEEESIRQMMVVRRFLGSVVTFIGQNTLKRSSVKDLKGRSATKYTFVRFYKCLIGRKESTNVVRLSLRLTRDI